MSGNLMHSSAAMVFLAISPRADLVVFCRWSGSCNRAGRDVSSRRLAKGARIRQADFVRAAFLRRALAAFGTEHFTLTQAIASLVPAWIPWHQFWAYLVGTCFIAAALSLVTKIQARLVGEFARLDVFPFRRADGRPGLAQNPRDRFALTLALRELSFSGGALALAASLTGQRRERGARHPCDDCAILYCNSRAVLQLRAIHARQSRSRHSAGTDDSRVDLRTRHLDVLDGHGLRSRGYPVACWQENPRRCHVAGVDRALRGVGRLRADRSSGTRQPGQRP